MKFPEFYVDANNLSLHCNGLHAIFFADQDFCIQAFQVSSLNSHFVLYSVLGGIHDLNLIGMVTPHSLVGRELVMLRISPKVHWVGEKIHFKGALVQVKHVE